MKYWLLLICTSLSFLFILSTGCKNTQKSAESREQFLKEKIIVLFREGVRPAKLEALFEEYKLKSDSQISRTENRWLMTYDMNKISPEEMLEKIKETPAVLEADFAPIMKNQR